MKIKRIIGAGTAGLALLLTLTGCVSMEVNVSVASDGETAELAYVIGYDKAKLAEAVAMTDEAPIDICKELSDRAAEGSPEYVVTWSETATECVATYATAILAYDSDGIKPTKTANELIDGRNIAITRVDDQTAVSFDFTGLSEPSDSIVSGTDLRDLFSSFDVNVTFPGKVTVANYDATISADGKTASWTLDQVLASINDKETLSVLGDLNKIKTSTFLSIGVILAFVALSVAVFLFSRRDKNLVLSYRKENQE